MHTKNLALAAITTLFICSAAQAGIAEVQWENPKDFRDIRPGNESRKHFQQRTFKSFEKHFDKLAKQLPEGYQLKLKVTDVDLAGNIEYGHAQPIRVVKQIAIPRIDFEYQLTNGKGETLQEDTIKLKDMNFLNHINRYKSRDSYAYEKLMLDKWFNEAMKEHIQIQQ